MKKLLVLLLVSLKSSSALSVGSSPGSSGQPCFKPGRCTNSPHLDTFPTDDEYKCRQSCKNDTNCGWFTYFPEQGQCQLLVECKNLEISPCPSCKGGPSGCQVPEPQACQKGVCRGVLAESEPVSNVDECQALCWSSRRCEWFTYTNKLDHQPLCLHFLSCSVHKETRSGCISGQPGCIASGLLQDEAQQRLPMPDPPGPASTDHEAEETTRYVALSISKSDTELYSPDGQCNFKLAKPPIKSENPVLAFVNNRVLACDGMKSCWEYNSGTNAWLELIQASFKANWQAGVVLRNKLYVIDNTNVHILDLTNSNWSKGPKPPVNTGYSPSAVGWKDSIILFGGFSNNKGVQIFNVTSQTWKVQSSEKVPMEIYWSTSLLIGAEKVLVAGSAYTSFQRSAAIYNPINDSWVSLQPSQASLYGTRLVKLGSRIFAMDGVYDDTVKEFYPTNGTWSINPIRPLGPFDGYHSVVAVPASMFAHFPGGCKGVL